MKKFLLLLFLCFTLFFPIPAHAGGPLKKLLRGMATIVTAPLEIPHETRRYWKMGAKKTDHILVWILCGFVKGTADTTIHLGSGLWDVVSFPVPIPADYKSLMKPDQINSD